MPSNLSPRRQRIVILAAAIACFGNVVLLLMKKHPHLRIACLALMTTGLVYIIVEFGKLRRDEKVQ